MNQRFGLVRLDADVAAKRERTFARVQDGLLLFQGRQVGAAPESRGQTSEISDQRDQRFPLWATSDSAEDGFQWKARIEMLGRQPFTIEKRGLILMP